MGPGSCSSGHLDIYKLVGAFYLLDHFFQKGFYLFFGFVGLDPGMSWLSTDTKGDIMRNYGQIAKDYGYHVSVIDLRNPTRSNGNNLLHLVNKYMDLYQANPDKLVYKARCEKYAKIISKTIILSAGGPFNNHPQQ